MESGIKKKGGSCDGSRAKDSEYVNPSDSSFVDEHKQIPKSNRKGSGANSSKDGSKLKRTAGAHKQIPKSTRKGSGATSSTDGSKLKRPVASFKTTKCYATDKGRLYKLASLRSSAATGSVKVNTTSSDEYEDLSDPVVEEDEEESVEHTTTLSPKLSPLRQNTASAGQLQTGPVISMGRGMGGFGRPRLGHPAVRAPVFVPAYSLPVTSYSTPFSTPPQHAASVTADVSTPLVSTRPTTTSSSLKEVQPTTLTVYSNQGLVVAPSEDPPPHPQPRPSAESLPVADPTQEFQPTQVPGTSKNAQSLADPPQDPPSNQEPGVHQTDSERCYIRSSILLAEGNGAVVYRYEVESSNVNILTTRAGKTFIFNLLGSYSSIDGVLYSVASIGPMGTTMTMGEEGGITVRASGETEITSPSYQRFWEDRMDDLLVAADFKKIKPGHYIIEQVPSYGYEKHSLYGFMCAEVNIRIDGTSVLASCRDYVLLVHSTNVMRVLHATDSHKLDNADFLDLIHEKLLNRTVIVTTGAPLDTANWEFRKIDAILAPPDGGEFDECRLMCGGIRVSPDFAYLEGLSIWEKNDRHVYPDLKAVLKMSPSDSYEIRFRFITTMSQSRAVASVMQQANLEFTWEFLEQALPAITSVKLTFGNTGTWSSDEEPLQIWRPQLHKKGYLRYGTGNAAWSFVGSGRQTRTTQLVVTELICNLTKQHTWTDAPKFPTTSHDFRANLDETLDLLETNKVQLDLLIVFLPLDLVASALPAVKLLLERLRINVILVPPVTEGKEKQIAVRLAREFQLKSGAIPWEVSDFPKQTMLISVLASYARKTTTNRVIAAATSFGRTVAAGTISVPIINGNDDPEEEFVVALEAIVKNIVANLLVKEGCVEPKDIFVYGDGTVDLLLYRDILQNAISAVASKRGPQLPELKLITITAKPTERWCLREKDKISNVPSGVIQFDRNGFLLQSGSHETLSVQPALYTVLNEVEPAVIRAIADTSYKSAFLFYHDARAQLVPHVFQYSKNALTYVEHGIGDGNIIPKLTTRFCFQ